MGLFSSHRNQQSGKGQTNNKVSNPKSKIHVLLRSQPTNDGESSSESRIIWSICVEEIASIANNKKSKSKSVFSLNKGKSSQSGDGEQFSDNSSDSGHSPKFTEFNLSDGNLEISRPMSSISILHPLFNYSHNNDNDNDPHSHLDLNTNTNTNDNDNDNGEGLLLKIQLPQLVSPSSSSPSSSSSWTTNKIEQILHSTTSTNATSLSTAFDTDVWLQFALIALQHAHVLPCPTSSHHHHNNNGNGDDNLTSFNVNDFTCYARNQLTEFEAEVLASSHQGEQGKYEKQVNYQTHLNENARLRRLFGHHRSTYQGVEDEDEDEQEGKGHGHKNGGWWVGKPHSQSRSREYSSPLPRTTKDPYGGLM